MFQSARTNQQFYILTKGINPKLDIGTIVSVSQPQMKFPSISPNISTDWIVDITVNVNGSSQSYQRLPANKDIADFGEGYGNIVVSISRDAMNNEIATLKTEAENNVKRVDEERQKIVSYEAILQQLNPEYAEKQRQEAEITNLKNQMAAMAQTNANLEQMLAKLLEKIETQK